MVGMVNPMEGALVTWIISQRRPAQRRGSSPGRRRLTFVLDAARFHTIWLQVRPRKRRHVSIRSQSRPAPMRCAPQMRRR